MKHSKLLVTLSSILLLPATLHAEVFLKYEDIDANADGWIDKTEAAQRHDLVSNWHTIDRDNDGVINVVEYLNYEARDYTPPYDSQDMDPGAGPL